MRISTASFRISLEQCPSDLKHAHFNQKARGCRILLSPTVVSLRCLPLLPVNFVSLRRISIKRPLLSHCVVSHCCPSTLSPCVARRVCPSLLPVTVARRLCPSLLPVAFARHCARRFCPSLLPVAFARRFFLTTFFAVSVYIYSPLDRGLKIVSNNIMMTL